MMMLMMSVISASLRPISIPHRISQPQIIQPHTQNIYHATIKLPSNEFVDIMYERVGVFKYKIKMSGIINVNGGIYYDDENNCALDDRILLALHKYRRSSVAQWYDVGYDTIEADILLEIIAHIKRIFKYELFIRV